MANSTRAGAGPRGAAAGDSWGQGYRQGWQEGWSSARRDERVAMMPRTPFSPDGATPTRESHKGWRLVRISGVEVFQPIGDGPGCSCAACSPSTAAAE